MSGTRNPRQHDQPDCPRPGCYLYNCRCRCHEPLHRPDEAEARPTHPWNDPDGDGHNCADCPDVSIWKCDAAAHSLPGLPSSFPVGSVSGSPKLPHAYNVREEE